MTRVDYYILNQGDLKQRALFACRLVEKAFNLGHRVYVHTSNQAETEQLDRLLWSFSPESFLPHSQQGDGQQNSGQKNNAQQNSEQISVGHGNEPGDHHDVLINLALVIPDFFSRFERVSEIVCPEPQVLAQSRENWKFYQDRGYPLHSHKL